MAPLNPETAASILGALANANRIRILETLSHHSYCQCELGPVLGIEQSNLSRHVKILTQAGILTVSREGTRMNLAITDREVLALIHLAEALALQASGEQVVENLQARQ